MKPLPARLEGTINPLTHNGCYKTITTNWRVIKTSPAGKRFQTYQRRMKRRRREHPVGGFLMLALGMLLVVAGIVLWLTPVLPGFFLSFVGLGILAVRIPGMARWLDRFELWLRRMWRHVRRK